MADPSFDVVSKIEHQEVDNALHQASKEVGQRYDFKNTGVSIEWSGDEKIVIVANAEERVLAALEVLKEKFIKRDLSLKAMDHEDPKPAGGSTYRLEINLVAGIDAEKGKKIVALIKEKGLKVQAQRQDDQVRVTGKKRDDLQDVIAMLKGEDLGIPLQFQNFK
jgi:uncharacterized protein YajQ (UPF0234 family)